MVIFGPCHQPKFTPFKCPIRIKLILNLYRSWQQPLTPTLSLEYLSLPSYGLPDDPAAPFKLYPISPFSFIRLGMHD